MIFYSKYRARKIWWWNLKFIDNGIIQSIRGCIFFFLFCEIWQFFITIIKDMFLTLLREAYFYIPFFIFLNKRILIVGECLEIFLKKKNIYWALLGNWKINNHCSFVHTFSSLVYNVSSWAPKHFSSLKAPKSTFMALNLLSRVLEYLMSFLGPSWAFINFNFK